MRSHYLMILSDHHVHLPNVAQKKGRVNRPRRQHLNLPVVEEIILIPEN